MITSPILPYCVDNGETHVESDIGCLWDSHNDGQSTLYITDYLCFVFRWNVEDAIFFSLLVANQRSYNYTMSVQTCDITKTSQRN